jgi:hypothetical protein
MVLLFCKIGIAGEILDLGVLKRKNELKRRKDQHNKIIKEPALLTVD